MSKFFKSSIAVFLLISFFSLPIFAQQPTMVQGLTSEKKAKINEKLNVLLSNYSIFYQNTRGLHWNIKGEHFFELHLKYEQLYNDALLKVDQIAERILALGGTPLVTYGEYAKLSVIKPVANISNAHEGVKIVCNSFKSLIDLEKAICKLATELGDEVTANLMVEYITLQEKNLWMYKAFLSQDKK